MPFTKNNGGTITYQGVEYEQVECGGGGDCLFLSLAWLFRRANVDNGVTYAGLRTTASNTLVHWAQTATPLNFPTMAVPVPDQPTAQNLGNPGVWGEIACVAALVEHYAALLLNPRDIEVHVLGPTTNDVLIYRAVRHLGHGNPVFTIHLLHLGYHYRALWPKNAVDGIHSSMLISKIAETAKIPQKNTTIFTSLKLVNGDAKSKTSTFDHASGAVLEIHHIDVGQGDSTLILIKDKDGAIRRSILIDTAEKTSDFNQQPVKQYLDSCIKTGNFRPIDVLILSHWDEDHMGAAAQFLSYGRKYFNTPLEIFDVGDSGMKDSDYQNYIDVIKGLDKNDFRRRPPDPGEMVLSCLGVEITCVARGEIGLNPQFDPDQIDSDLAEEYEGKLDALSYFNVGTDAFMSEDITSDDVVNLSAQDPGRKNNSSLAWTIVFGKFTYFTAGDLEHEAESNVIWGATSLLNRHMCAWKLSHHGSHHATRPGFLASALPRFGVASCGHQNKHGHPGRAVIPRIQDLNKTYACTVYVTGDVKSDPSNYGVPDNNCVFGNQGNVVITVTSTDANKDSHAFTVTARSGAGSFQCGDRSTSRPKIGEHKDLMAEQDINKKRRRAASQGHQRVRAKYFEDTARDWLYQKVGDILGYSVHDKAKIDAWLKAHDMEASFANVVDFLRQSFKQHYNPDTADADDMAVVQGDLHKSYEGCTVARNFLKKISDLQ